MTVLVLDSPELIARAAALEAAQAKTQVQVEDARVVHGESEASAADLPLYNRREETSPERQEEALALVI